MARSVYLLFGGVAYLIFLGTFLYLIAFVGDLPWVPHTVDRGPVTSPTAAIAIDLGLVVLFGLQHSVMAREGFKTAWTRVVPAPVERSFYVLFASSALILMFLLWRPLPTIVWSVDNAIAVTLLWCVFGLGWLIVLTSTFLINHFELFGLKQVWSNLRSAEAAAPEFRQPLFYRFVRHPLYAGFFIAFWATPVMTAGHLLLAAAMSAYMLIAIRFEERDLIRLFGSAYQDYRGKVGMLMPRLRRSD